MEMNGGYDVEVADTISSKYECQMCMLSYVSLFRHYVVTGFVEAV